MLGLAVKDIVYGVEREMFGLKVALFVVAYSLDCYIDLLVIYLSELP